MGRIGFAVHRSGSRFTGALVRSDSPVVTTRHEYACAIGLSPDGRHVLAPGRLRLPWFIDASSATERALHPLKLAAYRAIDYQIARINDGSTDQCGIDPLLHDNVGPEPSAKGIQQGGGIVGVHRCRRSHCHSDRLFRLGAQALELGGDFGQQCQAISGSNAKRRLSARTARKRNCSSVHSGAASTPTSSSAARRGWPINCTTRGSSAAAALNCSDLDHAANAEDWEARAKAARA